MSINFTLSTKLIQTIKQWFEKAPWQYFVLTPAAALIIGSIIYGLATDTIVAYGDAESHLNIAKRVIHSLTPGIAQLGGIWLPLTHVLMLPFVSVDYLWRTGLAGSIVSGVCYLMTTVYIYKFVHLMTGSKYAAIFGAIVFMTNPNILYLATTAMTELPLILFFILSSYYYVKFLRGKKDVLSLLLAALFGFCAALTRYDGWFLVLFEAGIIFLHGLFARWGWKKIEGHIVIFVTLAFFGMALWLLWGQLILGNAFYFTQSEFSARTQQQAWLAKGQLPAYQNLPLAISYYLVTSMSNSGMLTYAIAAMGMFAFLLKREDRSRFWIVLLLLVPFIFYVLTLYVGQSVIFIPHLTPIGFEWRLFNVRYGAMMIPVVAIFVGYLFRRVAISSKILIIGLVLLQFVLFGIGYSRVVSYDDGVEGLSHAQRPDAETWMRENYTGGLVLLDDYARTISIVRSGIPMQQVIYIGNKPYWLESLETPEKYATWIVMQKSDAIWTNLYEKPEKLDRLYTFFQKVYTSPEILVFKRIGS